MVSATFSYTALINVQIYLSDIIWKISMILLLRKLISITIFTSLNFISCMCDDIKLFENEYVMEMNLLRVTTPYPIFQLTSIPQGCICMFIKFLYIACQLDADDLRPFFYSTMDAE